MLCEEVWGRKNGEVTASGARVTKQCPPHAQTATRQAQSTLRRLVLRGLRRCGEIRHREIRHGETRHLGYEYRRYEQSSRGLLVA
jgi:hypothetical protein